LKYMTLDLVALTHNILIVSLIMLGGVVRDICLDQIHYFINIHIWTIVFYILQGIQHFCTILLSWVDTKSSNSSLLFLFLLEIVGYKLPFGVFILAFFITFFLTIFFKRIFINMYRSYEYHYHMTDTTTWHKCREKL